MVSQTEILALANLLPDKTARLSELRELHGKGVDSVVGKLAASKKVTVDGDVVTLLSTAEPSNPDLWPAPDLVPASDPAPSPVAAASAALAKAATDGGQAETLKGFLDGVGLAVVAHLGHRDCVALVERILLATAAEASDRGDLSPEVIHRLHSAAGDIAALRAVVD